MGSLNKVELSGTIIRDFDVKQFESGARVANTSLAVDRGNARDFVNIKGWDEIADALKAHASKNIVFIEGAIRTDSVPNKDDAEKKHTFTYVLVQHVKVISATNGTVLCDVTALSKAEREEQQQKEAVSA